jgi:hypothetical protein
MPKYRTTPTELTENPDMVNGGIEVSGVLFWLALLVDDEGRAILDSAALARRFNIEREVFERGLSYLVEHEFLQVYQAGRYSYYQILRWERWQNLSEKTKTPSKYPAPPQEFTADALPEIPALPPGNPGQAGDPPDKRREGEEKQSKENPSEDDEAQPPPNVLPFPAARADTAADAVVVSEKMIAEATKQAATILTLPITDDLARVIADYLGSPGLSLLGEADAAAEWIADHKRNHKRQRITPAFFRRWLKRETETTGRGSTTPSARTTGAVSKTSAQLAQALLAANGTGPPGAPNAADNPYRAYVNQRAELMLRRAREQSKEPTDETSS